MSARRYFRICRGGISMEEQQSKELEKVELQKAEPSKAAEPLEKPKSEPQNVTPKPKKEKTIYQQKIKENYGQFVLTCILFAFFYVLGEYKIEAGLGVLLATTAQLACCFAIIKQWGIKIKKSSILYVGMIFVLSVVMLWTNYYFLHFLQKKLILVLFIVIMFHQLYEERKWSLKTYLYNFLLLIFGSIASLFQPIEDMIEQGKKKEKQKWSYIFLGLGIGLPLTFIIVAMLMSADDVFKNMIITLLGNLFLPQNMIIVLFLFLSGFWLFYCFISALAKNESGESKIKQAEPMIAITFTSILLFVYVLFCGIQILYLFAQKGNLPQEYTYAAYARKGFFELLFVSIINFLMLVICNLKFRKSKVLDIILTAVSICNGIMIISSAYRMMLYVEAYHMTIMRMLVLWFLAMLAVSMIGVIYSIYKKEYKLYRYLFLVLFLFVTGISILKPGAFVVKYNLEHMNYYTKWDIYNWMDLSYDIVPELTKIDVHKIVLEDEAPQEKTEAKQEIIKEYLTSVIKDYEQRSIRGYHIGMENAYKAAKKYLQEH